MARVGRFNDLYEMMETYAQEVENEEILKTISENPNFETEYSTPKEALKAVLQWQDVLDNTVDLQDELRKIDLLYAIKTNGSITVAGERVTFKKNTYGKVKPFLNNVEIKGKNIYTLVAKLIIDQKPTLFDWDGKIVRKYTLQVGIQAVEINQVIDSNIVWFNTGYTKVKLQKPYQRQPTYTGREKLNEAEFPEIALQKAEQAEVLLEELQELISTSDAATKVVADRFESLLGDSIEANAKIDELEEELQAAYEIE